MGAGVHRRVLDPYVVRGPFLGVAMTAGCPQTVESTVHAARRAWFAAGVRRRDRRRLLRELEAELAAAQGDGALSHGVVSGLLGDDPGSAAREWAAELGLVDQRLRLVPLVPAVVLS